MGKKRKLFYKFVFWFQMGALVFAIFVLTSLSWDTMISCEALGRFYLPFFWFFVGTTLGAVITEVFWSFDNDEDA